MFLQFIEGLFLGHAPHKFFLTATHGYLAEGPCDMREFQQKHVIEIGEAQEDLKLNECGWGWPVTYDLDIGWIHMHTMLINDVA
jgi:hypothetical protein